MTIPEDTSLFPSSDDLFRFLTPTPATRRLPSKVRRNWRMAEILHQHFVIGASVNEIAERRHVTPATVRTAIKQGLYLVHRSGGSFNTLTRYSASPSGSGPKQGEGALSAPAPASRALSVSGDKGPELEERDATRTGTPGYLPEALAATMESFKT